MILNTRECVRHKTREALHTLEFIPHGDGVSYFHV